MSFGTTRCIGIVRTMAIFEHLICLKICVMRCFGVVRQYLHHRHRALWIGVYHLRGRHRCSFSDLDHRLQEQPYLYATLLYIVDWLLQWSKDYSDTTVFG